MALTANDQPLALGDRVTITDHLVRVYLGRNLLQEALDLMGLDHLPNPRRRAPGDGDWKLWVPAAWAMPRIHNGLRLAGRHSGTAPAFQGIVSGQVTLQQGASTWGGYEEPATWWQHGSTRAYRVAYSMNRQPVNVTADMIEEATRWLNE